RHGSVPLRGISRRETKQLMSFYVYILKSQINGDLYVGSTADVQNRFRLHNSGKVKSTKGYRPWVLLEARVCHTRSKAVVLEKFLKTGQQKEFLHKRYK
ncbi:MAG: GIY-YIG nuclease family protein, partial [Nitrososphaeraceae archaeon]